MNYIDFEYNGHKLSEYNCIVCHILTGTDAQAADIGSWLSFNTINYRNKNNSSKFRLLNSAYENAFSSSFEICKTVNKDIRNMYFTDDEAIRIIKWLNQKKFHKFRMIYPDGQLHSVYYNGSFNVRPVTLANKIIGMSLDFISDAPFGYYEPVSHYMDFSEAFSAGAAAKSPASPNPGAYILYDPSSEAGYIYPDSVRVEILENGNLTIHNSLDDEDTIIKNCILGEIITLDGKCKIIRSDKPHPNLYNDFNYHFLKVINHSDECDENDSFSKNVYTVSIKCRISFSYSPVAKIGVI